MWIIVQVDVQLCRAQFHDELCNRTVRMLELYKFAAQTVYA